MSTKHLEDGSNLLLADEEPPPSSRKGGRTILLLIVLAVIAYGGYRWWRAARTAAADSSTTQPAEARGRGGRGRGGNGQAAVVTVAARKMNMPVYLRGLGTAAASNTVTVRSRVDGQLIRVAFREGQIVQQGDLLAEIDKRPFEVQLSQAQGQLARDQALLESAKTEQKRNQMLLDQGLIPKQQFDTQAAQVGQYEGSIQTDQALIENANLQLTYSRIVAPISGQTGLRLVDQGNIVRAADAGGLVVITQLQPISVLFSIPEDDLTQVLAKLRAGRQLRVEAWDHDDMKQIADGVLLTADNQIDPTTGTEKLKAVFDNANGALFPNQFVNVRLLVDTLNDTVVVPGAAVQNGTQGQFVYVVGDNRTAQMRPVTIKHTEGSDVALASGVAAGEMVVLEGVDKIQDGARVDVQSPGQPAAPTAERGRREGGGRGEGRSGRGRGQGTGG